MQKLIFYSHVSTLPRSQRIGRCQWCWCGVCCLFWLNIYFGIRLFFFPYGSTLAFELMFNPLLGQSSSESFRGFLLLLAVDMVSASVWLTMSCLKTWLMIPCSTHSSLGEGSDAMASSLAMSSAFEPVALRPLAFSSSCCSKSSCCSVRFVVIGFVTVLFRKTIHVIAQTLGSKPHLTG